MRLLYRGTRSWLNCQHWIITIAKLSIPLVFFFFQPDQVDNSQPASQTRRLYARSYGVVYHPDYVGGLYAAVYGCASDCHRRCC